MKKASKWLALAAVVPLIAGCGQQEADTADSMEAAPAGLVITMPVTTESEEARAYFDEGLYALDVGRGNDANTAFEAAVEADPEFALGYLMVANSSTSTEERTANLARAVELAGTASEAEQHWIMVTQKGFENDVDGQLEEAEALVGLQGESPRAWLALAGVLAGRNEIEHSRATIEKAIELAPDMAAAHMQIGNSYLFLEPKDFAAAEQHFQRAVELAPDEALPYDLLGDVHRAQGNLEAAYDDYTIAAERDPENGSGLQQRGHVNSFLGNFDEARADYTRAIELEDARGTNVGSFFAPYRAFVNIYAGQPEAAIAELYELVEAADGIEVEGKTDIKINALTNIAQIAMHYEDFETASSATADLAVLMRQQAEEVGTDEFARGQDATIAYWEGMIAARSGDALGASAKADEITALVEPDANPRKMEPVHQVLGIAEFFQGNYEGALEHLSQGDPNNIYMQYYQARALEETGQTEEAAAIYDALAVYNFNAPTYAMIRADVLERAQD